MKIRQGFVSNSSSSSFIVIGKKIKDPAKALKEGKRVMVFVEAGGISGECEDWSMFLDKDSFAILKVSRWFKNQDPAYIEVNEKAGSSWNQKIFDYQLNVEEDVSGRVFAFYRDYSSPDSIEELRDFLQEVKHYYD